MTYGKIWFPVFLAFTLCAFVVYRRRRPAGLREVGLAGGAGRLRLARASASFLEYWTQWTGDYNGAASTSAFAASTVPGFLLTVLGSTVLGSPCCDAGSGRGCPPCCSR